MIVYDDIYPKRVPGSSSSSSEEQQDKQHHLARIRARQRLREYRRLRARQRARRRKDLQQVCSREQQLLHYYVAGVLAAQELFVFFRAAGAL